MVRFLSSAFKHGYTEQDVRGVLNNPIGLLEEVSRTGLPVVAVIGFAVSADHVIEVRYQPHYATGEPVVFHVQRATQGTVRRYRSAFD